MQFASIGSGSEGNGTLIRGSDGGCVLLDCGFSAREALGRMADLAVYEADLAAILVTHEHADHMKGVARLANRSRVPVFATWGTWRGKLEAQLDQVLFHQITPQAELSLAGLVIQAVPVPHDAREPCQFVFSLDGVRLGVLTDTGSVTDHMLMQYGRCDALMLECNHDMAMLANGPYPVSLKRRVGGPMGHLNNDQAADFLARLELGCLQHLVVTHISQQNNHPDLAVEALMTTRACSHNTIKIASQRTGFDWLSIVRE